MCLKSSITFRHFCHTTQICSGDLNLPLNMAPYKRTYADFSTPQRPSVRGLIQRGYESIRNLTPAQLAGLAALAGSSSSSLRSAYSSLRTPLNFPSGGRSFSSRSAVGSGISSIAQSRLSNSASTLVLKSGKKKKKSKKPLKAPFTKRQKKSVRRLIKVSDKDLMHSKETNVMHQISSAVNKVGWSEIILLTNAEKQLRLNYTTVGNDDANTVTRIEELDLTSAGLTSFQGRKFYFEDSHRFRMKNNTNAGADIIVYVLKCTDYTSWSPLVEITELRKAAFGTTLVLSKEDDFNQFYTIPRLTKGQRKWIMHSRREINLNGGQEADFSIKLPSQAYDPSVIVEEGGFDYMKGQYAIVMRIMGKPSHDTTTTSLLGISNTLVDILEFRKEKTLVKTSNIIKAVRQNGNSGVALVAAVVAEPEQVGVGPFDAV